MIKFLEDVWIWISSKFKRYVCETYAYAEGDYSIGQSYVDSGGLVWVIDKNPITGELRAYNVIEDTKTYVSLSIFHYWNTIKVGD